MKKSVKVILALIGGSFLLSQVSLDPPDPAAATRSAAAVYVTAVPSAKPTAKPTATPRPTSAPRSAASSGGGDAIGRWRAAIAAAAGSPSPSASASVAAAAAAAATPTARHRATATPRTKPTATPRPTVGRTPRPQTRYVLNTSTHKFHTPTCSSVRSIAAANYREYVGTRDAVINMGYSPCKRCNPK